MNKTTLDTIRMRCAEEGECLIWQQGTDACGYPQMTAPGFKTKSVRRIVLELDGRKPRPRRPTMATCGSKLCVLPTHLVTTTTRGVGRAAAARGAFSRPDRIAKVAAAKRAAGKLTTAKAQEIRLSVEPAHVLAEKYSVHKSLINRVRKGERWRDLSSPFAGLGQRAA